jgi:hypothetical protein
MTGTIFSSTRSWGIEAGTSFIESEMGTLETLELSLAGRVVIIIVKKAARAIAALMCFLGYVVIEILVYLTIFQ